MNRIHKWLALSSIACLAVAMFARPVHARIAEGTPEYEALQELEKEWQVGPYTPAPGTNGRTTRPAAIPDIFGPGAVLNVGNVWMKVTNDGFCGNPFTNISSDPSGQWPGASSVEYLNFLAIAVGAVNPLASDPTAVRRVSYATEWRPPTLDAQDRMYRAYDGIVNGSRYINDDSDVDPRTGDARIDEDFLDGRDNDGDGKIDEDFGAIGQQMYTCTMRDDTPQSINAAATERHVPLGLELQQSAWAYSIPGYTDFDVVQYDIYNRSGHTLDSLAIGWLVDMDCGPIEKGPYFNDDFGVPTYPHGDFIVQTKNTDLRLQPASDHVHVPEVPDDSALCARYKVRVQGFTVTDDDGDDNKTPGVGTFMLIDHSIDPTGTNGPTRVGFRSFRIWVGSVPYAQGGQPRLDQQRFELMTSTEGIDPETGFINAAVTDQKGDVQTWSSIGPWLHVPDGSRIQATVAFGVRAGNFRLALRYAGDYQAAVNSVSGAVSDGTELAQRYPSLDNALSAQIAFEGAYETRAWPVLPDFYGREYCVKAPPGQFLTLQGCANREPVARLVTDQKYECFDMDCDYCTGAYSKSRGGLFHRTWLAEAPPPSPATNMSVNYNYSDNPDRKFVPAGDRQVTIAWDNLSETTQDPKSGQFDFRGYKIWKVSNWTRPVGSGGPSEDDWTLLAEFRLFDAHYTNGYVCPPESAAVCTPGDTVGPYVFIPQTGEHKRILLHSGDLWDHQSGVVIRPDPSVLCRGWPDCQFEQAFQVGQTSGSKITRYKYPVGRYQYTDTNVKNGFLYFYSVTAFDSTGSGDHISELNSRRAAVEAESVTPQTKTDVATDGSKVWVVPNPYRGAKLLKDRPSSWDLTPNASDPTGTHIDFFGLPPGNWTIKIFTVSGDLVESINAHDAVNESIRTISTDEHGVQHPGYNRQQDNANDGQARWNLISRNGQDVVSGIYLFTVELGGNVKHRGKFVIIR